MGIFATIRRTATGDGGKLDVADERQHLSQSGDHIAFRSADVIAVEHQFQIWLVQVFNDRSRLGCCFQEVARRIELIQRLNQDCNASHIGHPRRDVKVVSEDAMRLRPFSDPRHDVDRFRIDGFRVFDGFDDCVEGLFLPARNSAKTIVSGGDVPAPRIEAQHAQSGVVQRLANLARGAIVGPVAFHGVEPRGLRRTNGFRQTVVGPQEAKVRREFGQSAHSTSNFVTSALT